ncbi:MAG: hypothetical protein AAF654_07845 [Myxococcota bacterium]
MRDTYQCRSYRFGWVIFDLANLDHLTKPFRQLFVEFTGAQVFVCTPDKGGVETWVRDQVQHRGYQISKVGSQPADEGPDVFVCGESLGPIQQCVYVRRGRHHRTKKHLFFAAKALEEHRLRNTNLSRDGSCGNAVTVFGKASTRDAQDV